MATLPKGTKHCLADTEGAVARHTWCPSPQQYRKKGVHPITARNEAGNTNLLQLESWHGCSATQFAAQTKHLQLKGVLPIVRWQIDRTGLARAHGRAATALNAALLDRCRSRQRSTAVGNVWVAQLQCRGCQSKGRHLQADNGPRAGVVHCSLLLPCGVLGNASSLRTTAGQSLQQHCPAVLDSTACTAHARAST